MATTTKPTVSIFGSTGGTGFAILRRCLKASYQVTVLVRNQEKLLSLLDTKETPSNLTVVTGSINDGSSAVQNALVTSDGKLVDVVFFCIGFVPNMSKPLKPFADVDDVNLCRNGTEAIVSAISRLKSEDHGKSPLLVVLSTTGISSTRRDIPIAMVPLYHLLATPHKDKKAMEDFLTSSAVPDSQQWVVIRPSLLVGDGKGEPTGKKIRVGTEKDGKVEKAAIGYTIKREDVGDWMFKNIVEGGVASREKWAGKAVSLTY